MATVTVAGIGIWSACHTQHDSSNEDDKHGQMMHGKQKSVKEKNNNKKEKTYCGGVNCIKTTFQLPGIYHSTVWVTVVARPPDYLGADLGGGGGGPPPPPPPPPWDDLWLFNTTGFVYATSQLHHSFVEHVPRPTKNSGSASAPAIYRFILASVFSHLLLSHITTILDKLFNQLHGTNYTAFHNQDFFNKSRPSCDYTNTLWLALPSVPVTQYRYHKDWQRHGCQPSHTSM